MTFKVKAKGHFLSCDMKVVIGVNPHSSVVVDFFFCQTLL